MRTCAIELWGIELKDHVVLGTKALFGHEGTYKEIMDNIKRECGE